MVYTHGYGVALGPVNEITAEGLPYLWVQDLPPDHAPGSRRAHELRNDQGPDGRIQVERLASPPRLESRSRDERSAGAHGRLLPK